jgi:hypothetical protein
MREGFPDFWAGELGNGGLGFVGCGVLLVLPRCSHDVLGSLRACGVGW